MSGQRAGEQPCVKGSVGDSKLNLSQQYALTAKRAILTWSASGTALLAR